jgi:hypothetical protein
MSGRARSKRLPADHHDATGLGAGRRAEVVARYGHWNAKDHLHTSSHLSTSAVTSTFAFARPEDVRSRRNAGEKIGAVPARPGPGRRVHEKHLGAGNSCAQLVHHPFR